MVEGSSHHELIAELVRLRSFAIERTAWNIEATAGSGGESRGNPRHDNWRFHWLCDRWRNWPNKWPSRPRISCAERIHTSHRSRSPRCEIASFTLPNPLGPNAKLAFVLPGSGNQFNGMGRDLRPSGLTCSAAKRPRANCSAASSRPQFLAWRADEALPRDLMFGQVAVRRSWPISRFPSA